MRSATHNPCRITRRTVRGSRAPYAREASAAVAVTTPKQNTHVRKNTIRLRDAPASASAPRRPIIAVSVVSMATQAS